MTATSASLPSSSSTVSATGSAPPSMNLFYPMEREDSTNALNIIEENDDHDLNAEAFADMAMSGMDMSLELNSLQIRAFLARNEAQNESNVASEVPKETASSEQEKNKPSAYEVLRNGTVHYSRREDKMQALQEHPVVASVSADGRCVGCKCGKSVRLNPPWYILKFEQHVASRNCSFLRQRPSKKRKRVETNSDRQESQREAGTGEQGAEKGATEQETEAGDTEEEVDSGEYSLQAVDSILRREFGKEENGKKIVVPPAENSPDEIVRKYKGAVTLRDNPHFVRITPDGRFAECKCSRIVLLGAPWQPGQFLVHVADKQKQKKRAKPASAVMNAVSKKKRTSSSPTAIARTMISAGVLMRPPTSANALLQSRKSKKSFPRDIRWDVARARGLLPCPGLRDERMNTFVTSAIQLTGGARHRQKIARELFPHLFPDDPDYDHAEEGNGELENSSGQGSTKKRQPKLKQQLLEAEKLLLHDVIEGEALWFVDKDGNSVRSLDCLGVIDSEKDDVRCASCDALRSNSALRTAAATKYKLATRPGPPRNPINRKFCSGRVCSLLESEFDMKEPYARVLRDLALAEIPGALNTWMEMATIGLSGDFDSHPALLGLSEAMVRLKDKEQRGVGLQNMTYSDLLDAFMRSLTELSPEACEFFQRHLGGRKQRQLLTSRSVLPNKRKLLPPTSRTGQDQPGTSLYESSNSTAVRVTSDDGFVHLLDPSVVGLSTLPHLSIGDIQDVDLGAFPSSAAMQNHVHQSGNSSEGLLPSAEGPLSAESYQQRDIPLMVNGSTDSEGLTIAGEGGEAIVDETKDAEDQMEPDPGAVAFLTEFTSPENKDAGIDDAVMPTDHVPCTGLRDENVQAYVSNAVQLVGGSRPRYVIARELFPRVFGNDKKVRIVDKLDEEQRLILQDAVFSECLWRVDKEGRCVRSLRCKRFVQATDHNDRSSAQNQGVCRACRDLRTVPNFRSVLSRSKVPKKLENIKYVPSVYTESDPFLRKLSKNSAFRGLYQTVKRMVSTESNSEVSSERLKQVYFWLRFARMGVFGHFKTHPVFEGLMKSMVEIKDKERRGVGKQNMQYSRALDDFMQGLAQISTEAFELFAGQFCGRTLRSQKVKRRSTSATPVFTEHAAIGAIPSPGEDPTPTQQHYLMPPDDLLDGRSLSTEESQRFMDRMLDEVRLSVSREMQLAEEEGRRGLENAAEPQTNEDDGRLGPETYLNDDGVLTTEI
ncbi:hypothetical protein P3T76_012519 [Phytophthora citrophthora]|uniref:Uncharacterized protein n=1 Tax=Phytophthora citrophthora TaxID=4793 RepID=A0AAD9LE20_9STRA|nr:hypothetical protein P3T76_012519 [Phytophthora citrophthora]